MLEAEWEFYENNRDELVEKYCGKFIVISGNKVVSAYDDEKAAYRETIKTIPLGSFMIHHITEEEEIIQLSPFVNAKSTVFCLQAGIPWPVFYRPSFQGLRNGGI